MTKSRNEKFCVPLQAFGLRRFFPVTVYLYSVSCRECTSTSVLDCKYRYCIKNPEPHRFRHSVCIRMQIAKLRVRKCQSRKVLSRVVTQNGFSTASADSQPVHRRLKQRRSTRRVERCLRGTDTSVATADTSTFQNTKLSRLRDPRHRDLQKHIRRGRRFSRPRFIFQNSD